MDTISKGREIVDSIRLKDQETYRSLTHFTAELRKKGGRITRQFRNEATAACVIWLMIYSILVSLPYPLSILKTWNKGFNNKDRNVYAKIINISLSIYNYLYSKESQLVIPLLKSKAHLCEDLDEVDKKMEKCVIELKEDDVRFKLQNHGNYYLCLYIDRLKNFGDIDPFTGRDILHYFIIHHGKDGKLFICSSYGSEFVSIPVNSKETSWDELENFIKHLNEPKKYRKELKTFLKKFFLLEGLPIRYSNNDDVPTKLRRQLMPIEEGIDKEVGSVLNNRSDGVLHLGIIDGMEDYVVSLVKEYENEMNVQTGGKQFRWAKPIANVLNPVLSRRTRKRNRTIHRKRRATISRRRNGW